MRVLACARATARIKWRGWRGLIVVLQKGFPFLYLPDSGKFLITFRKVKRLNKKKCNIGKQKTKGALNYNCLRKIEFIILLL